MNSFWPTKLFFKALLIHCLLFAVGYILYNLVLTKIYPENNDFYSFLFFLFFSTFSLVIIFWYTLKPLTKMIKSLSGLVETQNFSEDEITQAMAYENIPGEWNDLEIILKQLVKILRKNFKALSREKIEIQAVMNSVEEPIFAIDQAERVIFYNPAFGMVFGLEAGTYGVLSAHQILPDATILNAIRGVFKSGEPHETQVDLFIGNQAFSFTLSLSPLKRETGNSTYGVVAVFHDRSLQIETNKKRLDFVANASHELRTPVTMISSAVALMERSLANPEMLQELISNLKENTTRLVNLTEGLLDLSTIESGEKLDLQLIRPKEFTQKFLNSGGFNYSNIIVECSEDLFFQADPRRLDQVLTNLITNALRYSPQEKNIYIRWDKEDNFVYLRVLDSGNGIAPEHAKRVFERFYRIDAARTRKHGGTGIGLAIVKHIMKLHKGDVVINLDYKDGAEFVCSFPIQHLKEGI
jgi:two-component system, OmpR family, phosphate regulon sensor histidine kinase PhoR